MDIKRVLVPVDFSPPSNVAVNYGISLARQFRAKLTLLHVIESPAALMYTFPAGVDKIEKQNRERAERMMAALVAPEDQDDLDLQTIVKAGEIEEEIQAAVLEQNTDFVVMGTHGRRLLGRWFIGSVTQNMLRHMAVPVITVCRASRPLAFKRILFATDFSDYSAAGFQFATDLASATGARIVLAHVIEQRPAVSYETPEVAACFDEDRRRALEKAHIALAGLESAAKSRGVKIETIIAEGVPAEALLRIADENTVDLIAITVSSKGVIERALAGTTAERVIREAHVPVLSVPGIEVAKKTEVMTERGKKSDVPTTGKLK